MAQDSYVFKQVKNLAVTGQLNFTDIGTTYKLALVTVDAFTSINEKSEYTNWTSLSHTEIPIGGGYTGPIALSGVGVKEVSDINSDSVRDYIVYANDVTISNSTLEVAGVVIMKTDGTLICAIDVRNNGNTIKSNIGVFTVTLNQSSNGFLIIK